VAWSGQVAASTSRDRVLPLPGLYVSVCQFLCLASRDKTALQRFACQLSLTGKSKNK
jgi:hypothetical protein